MMSLVVAVVAMLTVAVIAFGAGVSFGAAVPRRAMGMFGDVAGILERAIYAVERAGERGNLVIAQLLESEGRSSTQHRSFEERRLMPAVSTERKRCGIRRFGALSSQYWTGAAKPTKQIRSK
ncbi:MAG: hypothetical protein SOI38_04825 [Eggerthellaceae bacterium]